MLPAYYDGMYLPPGDHLATWDDVVARFSGNERRRGFCDRLRVLLDRARQCGFLKVYLFGSFISAKGDPGDVDLLWVYRENLDLEGLSAECQQLLNYETMRRQEGWDMFCCSDNTFIVNYLLNGWRNSRPPENTPRGVIILDLGAR